MADFPRRSTRVTAQEISRPASFETIEDVERRWHIG
jgi:hypothetical protein